VATQTRQRAARTAARTPKANGDGAFVSAADLQPLLEALRASARGEVGVRLDTSKRGVVGQLGKAFNNLAQTRERTTANERHFDGHGGLFVNIKKNRWYSHGNQAGGDAVGLIRFALGCDYKAAFDWLRSNGYESFLGERPSPKRPVKEYDYTDESGARLYQTVRFEPKDFRQRRSDGNGGWIWKGPERPVPYKLPELIASGDAPVLIAGGEKDYAENTDL